MCTRVLKLIILAKLLMFYQIYNFLSLLTSEMHVPYLTGTKEILESWK